MHERLVHNMSGDPNFVNLLSLRIRGRTHTKLCTSSDVNLHKQHTILSDVCTGNRAFQLYLLLYADISSTAGVQARRSCMDYNMVAVYLAELHIW